MKDKFIDAKLCSEKSDFHRCHTGCVAVYKGIVIAKGWNSKKTSPLQAKYNKYRNFDPYVYSSSYHAEMMVVQKIRLLDIDFSKIDLYIWRGKNAPRVSKPCSACEKAIRDLGIKYIHYTGNNSFCDEKFI